MNFFSEANQIRNLSTVPACRACNQSKGDKPLMEWLRWVRQNDSYRWNRIKDFNYGKKGSVENLDSPK